MNTEPPLANPDSSPKKSRLLRPFFLISSLAMATLLGWAFWPAGPQISPHDLSRADGKPRFYATTYSKAEMPSNLPRYQQLYWTWKEYMRQHRRRNPLTTTFPATPVQPCLIEGLLNQCMEVTGTQYFIAVDLSAGGIDFGHTNALNGAQWVAAFERAIETSGPVLCYDYANKRNFEDTLLLIRERPGIVKIIPRTKIAEYQKAGLVKINSQ